MQLFSDCSAAALSFQQSCMLWYLRLHGAKMHVSTLHCTAYVTTQAHTKQGNVIRFCSWIFALKMIKQLCPMNQGELDTGLQYGHQFSPRNIAHWLIVQNKILIIPVSSHKNYSDVLHIVLFTQHAHWHPSPVKPLGSPHK